MMIPKAPASQTVESGMIWGITMTSETDPEDMLGDHGAVSPVQSRGFMWRFVDYVWVSLILVVFTRYHFWLRVMTYGCLDGFCVL